MAGLNSIGCAGSINRTSSVIKAQNDLYEGMEPDEDDYYNPGRGSVSVKPAGGLVTIVMVLLSTLAMIGAEIVLMRNKDTSASG